MVSRVWLLRPKRGLFRSARGVVCVALRSFSRPRSILSWGGTRTTFCFPVRRWEDIGGFSALRRRCALPPWRSGLTLSVLGGTRPGAEQRGPRGSRGPSSPSGGAAPLPIPTSSVRGSQSLQLPPRRPWSPVGATCRFPVTSITRVSLLAAGGGIPIVNVSKHPRGCDARAEGRVFACSICTGSFSRPRQRRGRYFPPRTLQSERHKLFRGHLGCFMLGFLV